MAKELTMDNGDVVDAADTAKEAKEFLKEHAPECPECDAGVHPRGRIGTSDYWVCENGHTFEGAVDDA